MNDTAPLRFNREKHIAFIQSLSKDPQSLESMLSAHLKMSAVYWSLTSLDLMDAKDALPRSEILNFVKSCFNPVDGGYGSSPGFDSHILYTLSAVQIAAILDALDIIPADAVAQFVSSRQKPDGSFTGDMWGEIDARFSYCAVATLKLIGKLDQINRQSAAAHILCCRNYDDAFGAYPEAESHGALTFCCLGTLSILDMIPDEKIDSLGLWLSQRQVEDGGLNGRPQKLSDVCYSWLANFILAAQCAETGGISHNKNGSADVFHTLFGICGLSMVGGFDLKPVDPTYCLPVEVVKRLGL